MASPTILSPAISCLSQSSKNAVNKAKVSIYPRKCQFCLKTLKNRRTFHNHKYYHCRTPREAQAKCDICLRTYRSKQSFNNHKKMCKPAEIEKSELDDFFIPLSENKSGKQKLYPRRCVKCSKICNSRKSINHHLKSCVKESILKTLISTSYNTSYYFTATSTAVAYTVRTVSSLSSKTKTTTNGTPATAHKIPMSNKNAIKPLFTSNSALSNELMSLNENSINCGQNILSSLCSLEQNPLPNSTSPLTVVSKDKSCESEGNIFLTERKALKQVKTSKTMTPSYTDSNSSKPPIVIFSTNTVPAEVGYVPAALCSPPVASTITCTNSNIIPVASPSRASTSNSLSSNIFLTPVLENSAENCEDPKNAVMTPLCSQVRISTPSTLSVTVSSIVKEPVYSLSSTENSNTSLTTSISSPLSASGLAEFNVENKVQTKFVPVSSSIISPLTNYVNRFVASELTPDLSLPDSVQVINQSTSKTVAVESNISKSFSEKSLSTIHPNNSSTGNGIVWKSILPIKLPEVVTSDTTPAINISTTSIAPSIPNLDLKLLNSFPNSTPISSASSVSVKSPHVSKPLVEPILFESPDEVSMLQKVANEPVTDSISKKVSNLNESKMFKVDRSVQTTEISNAVALKSDLQKKRDVPLIDDSAVTLKIKNYELEMKYLSTLTESKQLKVELAKKNLQIAELNGERAGRNIAEDRLSDSNRIEVREILMEIEDKFSGNKDEEHIYTMTKTSVLRNLYEYLEEVCSENKELRKKLSESETHDKFYKNLKERLDDEDF